MIIAIDFDGTCVTHEFPKIGRDIGAAVVLRDIVKTGHKLILFTMRSNRSIKNNTGDDSIMDVTGLFLDDAVMWFKDNDIPLFGIQENPSQKNWTVSPKCHADIYIDDSALGCPLIGNGMERPFVDWQVVRELLIERGVLI